MGKRRSSSISNTTQPSEIPTALIEGNPFDEDSHTLVEDATLDVTPTPTSQPRDIDKFRRPTKSEIYKAVEQVNTEAVDLEALAKASAAQAAPASGTDTFDIDVEDDDLEDE